MVRLGRLIAQFGGLDAFRFGPGLRSVTELANWFRLSVTELEAALETLVQMGALIALEGKGYAFPECECRLNTPQMCRLNFPQVS